jgi:hypothetical protein
MGFIILGIGNSRELAGIFTNNKTDNCPSFISVEFIGDRFVAIMNIPIASYVEVSEHFADRIKLSEDGSYFIRIMQQGNFLINDDVYAEGITLLFPCGSVRHHPFSRTRNTITIGQSHLIASK